MFIIMGFKLADEATGKKKIVYIPQLPYKSASLQMLTELQQINPKREIILFTSSHQRACKTDKSP